MCYVLSWTGSGGTVAAEAVGWGRECARRGGRCHGGSVGCSPQPTSRLTAAVHADQPAFSIARLPGPYKTAITDGPRGVRRTHTRTLNQLQSHYIIRSTLTSTETTHKTWSFTELVQLMA